MVATEQLEHKDKYFIYKNLNIMMNNYLKIKSAGEEATDMTGVIAGSVVAGVVVIAIIITVVLVVRNRALDQEAARLELELQQNNNMNNLNNANKATIVQNIVDNNFASPEQLPDYNPALQLQLDFSQTPTNFNVDRSKIVTFLFY